MPTFVISTRRTSEVLARVVLLFHGRSTGIERLSAGPGQTPDVLRIEVTVRCEPDRAKLLEANLYKLVDVLLVERWPEDRGVRGSTGGDGNCR
jgi:acetolactate synthase-1/3 small subunit